MRGTGAIFLAGACALGIAACGGGDRQDANEPEGTYRVEVVSVSFPSRQSIAQSSQLKIRVKNADTKQVPNVAVTVETRPPGANGAPQAFAAAVADPQLADPSRPVWILDKGPAGGDTAYTNTWALGPLAPGSEREFVWRVTAVKPGAYTVDYAVSPGLGGRAKTTAGEGRGSLNVRIDGKPPIARVGEDGKVIREPAGSKQ
jgi:hypothetical protein